ncbi:hypothetical protein BKA93DRAFT_732448 [Sparassis latifolia]|uniref:Uncharacterized calcium-binding protein n=1 Tax=Sparassis crispa TaxID=139825 RepID=A0A401G5S6_9APHY|nr:Uncharacterized calcium-binding protein [Sparassis crispa]GBE77520.1 Uncharacterized calcium-binding protein [Sparassis crispa]
MYLLPGLAFFVYLRLVATHTGHDEPAPGETVQQYAQRHMASEHHIDSFDTESFFHLHDLNRDGVLDKEEIEAIYGVHHVYSQKKSKDEVEHQKKADHIVNTVLRLIDKNGDGKITLEEFKQVGLEGLPNFDALGAEGHHYDVESEFFLHHEEQFHSLPETQTDDAYSHPEDLEHFAAHDQIEREEAAREAKFQGITVEEALAQHEPHEEPVAQQPAGGAQQVVDQHAKEAADSPSGIPRVSRPVPESDDPAVRFQSVKAQGEWGDEGYKPPRSPSDRLKKNLPYKYKFRRTWGDF